MSDTSIGDETGSPDVVDTTCSALDFNWKGKPKTVYVCVHRAPESQSHDILYLFHGMGENARHWIKKKTYGKVRGEWRDLGFDAPVVVTLSFGHIWLLAPEGKRARSGLYELVVRRIMPYVEKVLVPDFTGRRYLVGMSMGGFNAAELYLRNPQLFKKAALICPATTQLPLYPKSGSVAAAIKYQQALERARA